jgi:hypothetical protein
MGASERNLRVPTYGNAGKAPYGYPRGEAGEERMGTPPRREGGAGGGARRTGMRPFHLTLRVPVWIVTSRAAAKSAEAQRMGIATPLSGGGVECSLKLPRCAGDPRWRAGAGLQRDRPCRFFSVRRSRCSPGKAFRGSGRLRPGGDPGTYITDQMVKAAVAIPES